MTIGASVLEEQQPNWRSAATGNGGASLFALPQQEQVEPLRPALPSLLRAAVSDPHSNSNDAAPHHPRRILLLQSVRDHSLAMDLAISLASGEPCRCFVGGGRPGSSGSHGSWRSSNGVGVDHSCAASTGCQNCVAVTLIVPAATTTTSNHGSPQPEEDSFPPLCRQIQEDGNGGGVSTIMSQQHLTLNLTEQRREANFHVQQQQALHRIQVRHVSSLQDIWDYLLRIPGLPVDQQPVGGILLCGLDALVQQQQHDAAVATIRMTQTVAILIDSVACLKRLHGRLATVAVTLLTTQQESGSTTTSASSKSSSVEAWFRAASSFWSPVVLRVLPSNTNSDGSNAVPAHAPQDQDEVAVSQWNVLEGGTTVAWYAVLRNLDHEQRIVWAGNNNTKPKKLRGY